METFSALLAICEFPAQRPVTRSFDVYFDMQPNKRLSKQSWGWWFETPSRSFNVIVMYCSYLQSIPSENQALSLKNDVLCNHDWKWKEVILNDS